MLRDFQIFQSLFPRWLVILALTAAIVFRLCFLPAKPRSTAVRKRVPVGLAQSEAIVEQPSTRANIDHEAISKDNRLKNGTYEELLTFLREQSINGSDDILGLLRSIGKTRPIMAIQLAQATGRTDEERADWVATVTRDWAQREPKNAWQWYAALGTAQSDQFAHGSLMNLIIDEMASRIPDVVIEQTETILKRGDRPNSIAPQVMVGMSVEALIRNGQAKLAKEAVERWANSREKPVIGAASYHQVAVSISESSPEDAGKWLESFPSSEDRDTALGTFAGTWVEHDPKAALNWSGSLDPKNVPAVRQQAFQMWAELDPAAAGEWLNEHWSGIPKGKEADLLVAGLLAVSPISRTDPQGAIQWAGTIENSALRERVMETVVQKWSHIDRNSAVTYLGQTTSFTPDQKASIIKSIFDPEASRNFDP